MRLQSIFFHFAIIAILFEQFLESNGLNFSAYKTIDTGSPPEFSCNNNVKERIVLRNPCGTFISPCYPDKDYPSLVNRGVKIYDLNAYNGTSVIAYQFILEDYESVFASGKLDFFPTQSVTLTNGLLENTNNVPELYIFGSASSDKGAFMGGPNKLERIKVDEKFELHSPSYILQFFSAAFSKRGFRISYCADFDLCETDIICSTPGGGTCRRDGFRSYFCVCSTGYIGPTCVDVNECLTSPCDSNAHCDNTPGSFTCKCNDGYILDGNSCADVNECLTSPCNSNAHCENTPGLFTCKCNDGFIGDGFSCTELNQCEPDIICSSPDGGKCTRNGFRSYSCVCNTGYTGATCVDLDECLASPCDLNAHCENSPGSFRCECKDGFIGNGFTCEELNECEPDIICSSPVGGTCTRNGFRSYSCVCNTGYTGPACVDLNECLASPCDSNAHCVNTPGSFTCACNNGFAGDGFTCEEINQCDPDIICSSSISGTCTRNGFLSYACVCNTGYTGAACTDVNECLASSCDSNAHCVNSPGSFTCTCNYGFIGNGFNCTELNECKPDIICSSPVGGTCTRSGFHSYSCICNTGFTGAACVDVNECLASPCDSNAHCDNTPGSFTCTCNNGFVGDGFNCKDFNLCKPDIICSSPDGGTCRRNGFRSYSCVCNDGYTGPACVDLNECFVPPCDSNAHCENTPGSFTCKCNHGFIGDGFNCAANQTKVTLKSSTSSASATNSILSTFGISLRANISLTGNDSRNIQDRNDPQGIGENVVSFIEKYISVISGVGGALLLVLLSVLLFLIFGKGRKNSKKRIFKGFEIAGKNNSTYGSVTPNITKV